MKWRVFSKQDLILSKIARKKHCKLTYINWKVNRKEHTEEALQDLIKQDLIISQIAKDTHSYDRAKVKPPTPSTLNVFPKQL